MSGFVVSLVVVGAAIAIVVRAVGQLQPATAKRAADRERSEHAPVVHEPIETPAEQVRRPRHLVAEASAPDGELRLGRRIRSAMLLILLVAALGAAAAVSVGFLVVIVLTAVRTAIA